VPSSPSRVFPGLHRAEQQRAGGMPRYRRPHPPPQPPGASSSASEHSPQLQDINRERAIGSFWTAVVGYSLAIDWHRMVIRFRGNGRSCSACRLGRSPDHDLPGFGIAFYLGPRAASWPCGAGALRGLLLHQTGRPSVAGERSVDHVVDVSEAVVFRSGRSRLVCAGARPAFRAPGSMYKSPIEMITGSRLREPGFIQGSHHRSPDASPRGPARHAPASCRAPVTAARIRPARLISPAPTARLS